VDADVKGPRLVNPFPRDIVLSGKLLPWRVPALQPAYVALPGSDLLYLPVFSTVEGLRDLMKRADVPYQSVKQILDGREFLMGFTPDFRKAMRIIVDPYFLPDGKARFSEVRWPVD